MLKMSVLALFCGLCFKYQLLFKAFAVVLWSVACVLPRGQFETYAIPCHSLVIKVFAVWS